MKIKQQQYQELLARDQLTIEREERKVFLEYGENGHLSFIDLNSLQIHRISFNHNI